MKPASIWDWLGPFGLLAAFITYLAVTTLDESALCRGDDGCIREWVGALGGWGAVVAAVATIIFIQKQIADTNRHHRELLALELQPKFAVANRTWISSNKGKLSAEDLVRHFAEFKGAAHRPKMFVELQIAPRLRVLIEILGSGVFDDFEREIGSAMPHMLDSARSNLGFLSVQYDTAYEPGKLKELADAQLQIAFESLGGIIRYFDSCEQAASAFNGLWGSLLK